MSDVRKFAERVQPIYTLLNWEWGGDFVVVPTVEIIEERISDLISQIREAGDTWYLGRGGLFVRKDNTGHIEYGMEILG